MHVGLVCSQLAAQPRRSTRARAFRSALFVQFDRSRLDVQWQFHRSGNGHEEGGCLHFRLFGEVEAVVRDVIPATGLDRHRAIIRHDNKRAHHAVVLVREDMTVPYVFAWLIEGREYLNHRAGWDHHRILKTEILGS
jgi:hypothetical protein